MDTRGWKRLKHGAKIIGEHDGMLRKALCNHSVLDASNLLIFLIRSENIRRVEKC